MRNLVLLLLSITLFVSCSDDDDDNTQDYTSFVFYHNVTSTFENCIAAYKKDGNYYKIGELGTLEKDKQSTEIRITDSTINDIYLFSDYHGVIRFDYTWTLSKNRKNIFQIKDGTKGIDVTDKTDPTQYPQ